MLEIYYTKVHIPLARVHVLSAIKMQSKRYIGTDKEALPFIDAQRLQSGTGVDNRRPLQARLFYDFGL